jgi:hypothetical protein
VVDRHLVGEVIMSVGSNGAAVRRRFRAALVILGVATLGLLVALPTLGSGFGVGGPRDQMPGAEPGSEKARMIEQFQREYEAGLLATMAPPAGRPAEQWNPVIVEGIDNFAESPFEGSDFVLSNMWRSALTDGRVTQVYVGVDSGGPGVIVTKLHVMTGVEESRWAIPLPSGSGVPRLTAAEGGILLVSTASGRSFQFDVARGALSATD